MVVELWIACGPIVCLLIGLFYGHHLGYKAARRKAGEQP